MRRVVYIGALSIGVLLLPVHAKAQESPSDSSMVMFRAAEILVNKGNVDEANRLLKLILRHYPRSEGARLARERLAGPGSSREGNGGTELIVYSTFYGASLGVIVPAAFGADSPEPYGAGILLGAPAGYGLSRLYTNRYGVATGQARAMTFGSWWGSWQGYGWREVFDIGDDRTTSCFRLDDEIQCFDVASESDRAPFTAILVGGLSGLAAGTILGRIRPVDGSSALITNFSALWGSWFGAVLHEQFDEDEPLHFSDDDDDAALTSVLIAGNVGLLAGAIGGPALNWTTGQAWAVHLSGIAGLIGGFGIDLLAGVEELDTGLLIPGLTSAAALVVGATLVGTDPDVTSVSGGTAGSLLAFAEGQWRVGTPMPMPTVTKGYRNGKTRFESGAQVSLVRMRW